MAKRTLMIVSILGVAFVGVLAWGIITLNQLGSTRESLSETTAQLLTTTNTLNETQATLTDTVHELTSTQGTLTSTQDELAGTRSELSSTQNELSNTQSELTSTQSDLAATKDELTSTQSQLDDTQNELTDTKSELRVSERTLANLQTLLLSTQQQLTSANETLRGLGISLSVSENCYDVELVDSPTATNPAWNQLSSFLYQDQTEAHTYILNEYDCSQFSRDLHNRAEAAGLRAAEVQINFENELSGHAFNAFLTSDYGLVFVDCTEAPDKIAHAKKGATWRAIALSAIAPANFRDDNWWSMLSSYYYIPSSNGGEVVTESLIIYW